MNRNMFTPFFTNVKIQTFIIKMYHQEDVPFAPAIELEASLPCSRPSSSCFPSACNNNKKNPYRNILDMTSRWLLM